MCNCREKKGYALALSQALSFERSTGKQAAIFSKNDILSFTDKANINKVEGICCYYTTDNKEHKVVKEIEVVEPEVVEKKQKRSRRKKED